MATDEMTALHALMIATLALMLASHRLPVIPIDLSRLTWQPALDATACPECSLTDSLLAP